MEVYLKSREEWRVWLENNHSSVNGVWLIYSKKVSGKPRVPYDDAVEEALCFGWIDGKIKRIDEDFYEQWFTPRRPGSKWSKLNLGRARKLIEKDLMKPEGLKVYEEAMKNPELNYDIRADENLSVPEDLIVALKKNQAAHQNFINFPPSSRKLYVFWLNSAKREDTRKRRIAKIIEISKEYTSRNNLIFCKFIPCH